jgi:hypothetical protein
VSDSKETLERKLTAIEQFFRDQYTTHLLREDLTDAQYANLEVIGKAMENVARIKAGEGTEKLADSVAFGIVAYSSLNGTEVNRTAAMRVRETALRYLRQ